MRLAIPSGALEWGGVALVGAALFAGTYAMAADPAGLPRRSLARYVAWLERKLRLMFVFTPGVQIVLGQAAAVFVIVALALLVDLPLWWVFLVGALALPPWWIERMRRKRVEAIEQQLDGFLLALANALKATPSIGDAFASVQSLVQAPRPSRGRGACSSGGGRCPGSPG